jgi:hypothetical protein
MESHVPSNPAPSSGSDMTQPEVPLDDEFEKITDGMSCIFITSSILDIDEMIIEEQWKRQGGEGSQWEQALVKHKDELQQGLDWIKERMSSGDGDTIPVVAKEVPTIVVQEAETEDDEKMARAFASCSSSPPRPEVETETCPQSPLSSSSLREMACDEDFEIVRFLSEEEADEILSSYLPPEYSELVNPIPAMQAILEELVDIEQPTKRINTRTQTLPSSNVKTTPADAVSTQSVALATAQPTESSIPGVARGTKRDSDEAGLDEQDISKQLGSIDEEESVTTPPQKRQETGDNEITDPSPTNPPPKTPAKGRTPGRNAKTFLTPAAARRSRRHK